VVVLASGLEIRNQLRKRQEKNEFNFRLRQKIFLTGKMKQVCRRENRNSLSKKFRVRQTATVWPPRTDVNADSQRLAS
jgi:hypothetical protein